MGEDETRALQSEWFEIGRLLQPVVRERRRWEMLHAIKDGLTSDLHKPRSKPKKSSRPQQMKQSNIYKTYQEMLDEAWPTVQRTKVDGSKYKRHLRASHKALSEMRRPPGGLENLLRDRLLFVETQLAKVPASPEKCVSLLQTWVRYEPEMDVLSYLAARGEQLDPGDISYWVNRRREGRLDAPPLGYEAIFGSIEFDFFNRVDRIAATSHLRKLEVQIRRSIAEESGRIGEWRIDGLSINFRNLLCTLWLCARVPGLRQAVSSEARKATLEVVACQKNDGSWHETSGRSENFDEEAPSPFATGLAVCAMQSFLPSNTTSDQQVRAIAWLCHWQLQNGSWADSIVADDGDFWATLAALTALKNTQAVDLARYIDAGEKWMLSQQNDLGAWEGRPFSKSFASVQALQYFGQTSRGDTPGDRYTAAAIQLLERASEILNQTHLEYSDRALVIFATHHALEFFLYGILQLPSVSLDIFNTSKRTIGLMEALSGFRDHLVAEGKLAPHKLLSHRTQISEMINDRDNSVHKAQDVPEAHLKAHLETAKRFMSKYSLMMMDRDILG
jgi:hypothetical protein